jgi:hypothetical protein
VGDSGRIGVGSARKTRSVTAGLEGPEDQKLQGYQLRGCGLPRIGLLEGNSVAQLFHILGVIL